MAVKRSAAAAGRKVTLRMAKKAVKVTAEGRRRLDLSNMGIAAFPRCLLKMADVDELDLSRNALRKLPDCVGDLTWLSALDLHSNRLEALPEALGRLAGLTRLDASNNRLSSGGLPAALGSLARLRSLNLGLNRLERLPPGLEGLTELQEVGLFDNLLAELPGWLAAVGRVNAKRNPCTDVRGGKAGGGGPLGTGARVQYLAQGGALCRACVRRCEQGAVGRGAAAGDQRERGYAGLVAPNSVAAANQDAWRIRG